MNRNIILGIVLIFTYLNSNAQIKSTEIHKNKINFKIGYDKTFFADKNFSPLNYQSNSYAAGLGYSRLFKNNNLAFVNVHFSNGVLKTMASDYFNADRYLLNLKLGYLKNVALLDKRISLEIGGQYHTFINLVSYRTLDDIYLGFHGIDLVGKVNFKLTKKHNISTTLEIPIFGLLVRPPYSGKNKFQGENGFFKIATTGNWTTLDNYFALQWALNYQYQLSEKMDFIISASHKYK